MTDVCQRLDADAWLRRLGQDFSLDKAAKALTTFISVPVLEVQGHLKPDQPYDGKLLTFRGAYRVRLQRDCVVSLEPFQEFLEGSFERSFTLSPTAPPVPEGAEEAEAFPFEGLSLMDMLGDEVALNVTAFPRKPGAQLPDFTSESLEDQAEDRPNPFAILQQLKTK